MDEEQIALNPLHLNLDDSTLARNIVDRIQTSTSWYESKKQLTKRRKKNVDYLFGRQLDESKLKYYNARYVDNIIYEAETTIKPIALSRVPDLIVNPGNESQESKEVAQTLTDVINSEVRQRSNRKVLGLAMKHHPAYFTGIVKAMWDRSIGDYRFVVVHPERVVVSHTANDNDPHNMDFIAEKQPMSVKQCVMMFPKKEDEIRSRVAEKKNKDKKDESLMATEIDVWEVWFTWYEKHTDEKGESKWQTIESVAWLYDDDIVLDKMKHPYWDWSGKENLYTLTPEGVKQKLTEEEIMALVLGDETDTQIHSQKVFNNFMKRPTKPYMFFGYDQWGEMAYDETSRIEQVIYLQDNVNKRGKQITEMNDRARGKHVFSTESGLTRSDIENMDMENPDEDLIVDGDVRLVHNFIAPDPAPPQLYTEQEQERQKAFAKMKTHATTRGEKMSDVATTNQILRESDFGAIDDLVEDTINEVASQMAEWALQFIKLFYSKSKMRSVQGGDGEVAHVALKRDMVEDGMEVAVSASGVDKMQAKREAFERANMQLTDPLTFFEDTETPNPKERTERLIVFMSSPELYMQQYVHDRDVQGMADALSAQPVAPAAGPEVPPATPAGDAQLAQTFAPQGGGGAWPGYGGGGHRGSRY